MEHVQPKPPRAPARLQENAEAFSRSVMAQEEEVSCG